MWRQTAVGRGKEMDVRLLVSAMILIATSTNAGEFEFSTVVVPIEDELRAEVIDNVESAIRDTAGVLSLSVDRSRPLREIIAEECPGATDGYLNDLPAAVAHYNPNLFPNGSVTLDTEIPVAGYTATQFYIPYCLGAFSKYVVRAGDQLWQIYQQQRDQPNGIADWAGFQQRVTAINGERIGSGNLAVGDVISLPGTKWEVPVAAQKAGSVIQRLNQIDEIGGKAILDKKQKWGTVEQEEEVCSGVNELDALKGAESRLWAISDTLMLNDALDRRHALNRPKAAVNVAVLDNGIVAHRHPAMIRLLKPVRRGVNSLADVNDPVGHHGTGVLFSAAGGYLLSALNPLTVPVHTASYNVYLRPCPDVRQCRSIADPSRLKDAMDDAIDRETDTSAVNISIAFSGEGSLNGFDKYLGHDKDLLVVAAAGNGGDEIGDALKVYPAIFGGEEGSNLITVASLDLQGRILPRSNWSPENVDIATWACNVPVAEFDPQINGFVRRLRTGTSYAAPQVLFGAAMLLRETPARSPAALTPSELKIRLVTSADHDSVLWNKVRHGRVLNLAKALSVHTDLVQLKTGALLRGRLDFGGSDESVDICGNQSVRRSELLSIADLVRPPASGTQRYLIYRRSDSIGGEVETRWCNALTADLELTDPFTGNTMPLNNDDIASVVLATIPYWEN
ncbi:hypothetical protein EHS39_23500 [Ensifer sp. MPMI2T]|nr:hypothetical protein EHS39_23500 [Ensifer sp. MPMI2T]